ncbi:hypothetical protein MY11210_008298 [Beauveria gryllotalpidicola]
MFSLSLKTTCLVAALYPRLGLTASANLAGVDWEFDKTPSDGLKDITFGFNMANSTPQTGFYYAQEFSFGGIQNPTDPKAWPALAYTGVQPREVKDGRPIVHAAFSSFIANTTTTSSTCHGGADGHSDGVSCSVEFPGDYSHTYNIVVENTAGTTWRGTIVDAETAESHVIGTWTLPAGAKGINHSYIGFVEYYPWNGEQSHVCENLPRAAVTFYNPTSKTYGAGTGKISKAYQSGDCVNKEDYYTSQVSEGVYIEAGFSK